MSYEVINQELGVYSCSISDLTMDQVSSFLKLWNDGSTIGSLTMFYDTDGRIVINESMKDFDIFKETIVKYVRESEDVRKQFKATLESESIKEIFLTLDAALRYRKKKATKDKINEILPILNLIHVDWDTFEEISAIYGNYSRNEYKIFGAIDAYNYGMIQGKRAERAKKKRLQSEVIA